MWNVEIKKKALKNLVQLPRNVQQLFAFLKRDLEQAGPVRTDWPNYSKLSKTEYHCHLNHHYVACWTATKETITIEVYYVGSRESAPY